MAKNEKYGIPQGQFKAGNHWCQRFMKRNGLSLRQKTTLAQRLPDDYEEKIVYLDDSFARELFQSDSESESFR